MLSVFLWCLKNLLVFSIVSAAQYEDDGSFCTKDRTRMVILLVTILYLTSPEAFGDVEKKTKIVSPHQKRKRANIWSIFQQLGPTYVHHAYWMDEESFFDLHRILHKHMTKPRKPTNRKKKNSGKNGAITSILRRSVAIWYFAGGDP